MGGDGERDYCVIVIIFHIVDFFLVGRGFFSVLGVFHVKFLCCGDCFLISLISRIFACSCGECGIEFPNKWYQSARFEVIVAWFVVRLGGSLQWALFTKLHGCSPS